MRPKGAFVRGMGRRFGKKMKKTGKIFAEGIYFFAKML